MKLVISSATYSVGSRLSLTGHSHFARSGFSGQHSSPRRKRGENGIASGERGLGTYPTYAIHGADALEECCLRVAFGDLGTRRGPCRSPAPRKTLRARVGMCCNSIRHSGRREFLPSADAWAGQGRGATGLASIPHRRVTRAHRESRGWEM